MAAPWQFSSSTGTRETAGPGLRRWHWALALLGSLNLLLGLVLALRQPFRADDLWKMYGWCREWLYAGEHLYGSRLAPDYPPNAIVTYSLLATIPDRWLVALWAIAVLAVTPLLPFAVLRSVSPRVRISTAILPTLLFMGWGGARTLLQFTQPSLLLAFVALAMPGRGIIGGACLGVALAKPHIAGPIALWAACTRRYRIALAAATFVALEIGVYCLRAGVTPLAATSGWVLALRELYTGTRALNGYTSVRPWAVALIGDRTADGVWIGTSLIALGALCAAAWRDRTQTLAMPALLCLWSLLAIYHNLNNLILMLPAFIFLLTVDDPETRRHRASWVAVIQALLIVDIPVRLRTFSDGALGSLIVNVDRVLVLGTFVFVSWEWMRLQRRVRAAGPPELPAARGDLQGATQDGWQ